MITVNYKSNGTGGWVLEDGDPVGFLRLVDDWYPPGQFQPRPAWVIGWLSEGIDWTQRSLIELEAAPGFDPERIEDLTVKARHIIELGAPPEPVAFGFGKSGLSSNAETPERIAWTSHAVQAAEGRQHDPTRAEHEDAVSLINIAVVETAAWLRGRAPR